MKISMNLLPYREARRKEIRHRFWAGFGLACGLAVVLVASVHLGISSYISVQDGRNNFIKSQNDMLDGRIKEIGALRENIDAVKAQQDIIGKLQSDRASPTHLLEQMVRLVPDGMFISTLKQKNSDVIVSGMAQSSDMVSAFMVSIQESAFLINPELIEIKASTSKEGRRMQQFSLKFSLRVANDEKAGKDAEKRNGAAPAGAPPTLTAAAGAPTPAVATGQKTPPRAENPSTALTSPSPSAATPDNGAASPGASNTVAAKTAPTVSK